MLESLKKALRETDFKEQKACFLNTKIRMIDSAANILKEINPAFDQEAFVVKLMDTAERTAEEMAKIAVDFKELVASSAISERDSLIETRVAA